MRISYPLSFRGVSEKVFRGVAFLYFAGYFRISGLSYSVAGQFVLKNKNFTGEHPGDHNPTRNNFI